jgi:hypothetical protein
MIRVTASKAETSIPAIPTSTAAPMRRTVLRYLPFLLPAFVFMSAPTTAMSASSGLGGTWRGSGWMELSSGKREHARCRVHVSEQSRRTYSISAVCATESGRVSQNAVVRNAGGSSYVGRFYNAEYDVSGSIHLSVHGGTATARLTSSSAAAVISLSR